MIWEYVKPLCAVAVIAGIAWAIGGAAIMIASLYPTTCEYTIPQE